MPKANVFERAEIALAEAHKSLDPKDTTRATVLMYRCIAKINEWQKGSHDPLSHVEGIKSWQAKIEGLREAVRNK